MLSRVNAGTIRENRRHGTAIFYQKKMLWSVHSQHELYTVVRQWDYSITNNLRTSTIWAPPRAASVGKSFALLNINPAPIVKKLKATERVRDDTEVILLPN